jgi:hypothetical protein
LGEREERLVGREEKAEKEGKRKERRGEEE